MGRIYRRVDELVGRTPLLALDRIGRKHRLDAEIIAKLESFNPGGSAKDRVALAMINAAEMAGLLKSDSVIIEPTSGNTGIGLASIASARGIRVIIVMPDSMSVERRQIMRAYGAELVLTPGALGMKGAIEKAEELAAEIPGSFIPGQFTNFDNPEAHYVTTGPEIDDDTDGELDFFVATVGTGGTISGTGRYLKERYPNVRVIAVEPATSAVLSGMPAGTHKIQGIGAGFIPEILDRSVIDEVIAVTDEDAFAFGRELGTYEGILAGISSGAALCAAVTIAHRPENTGKRIIVLLPDTGDRYLSTEMWRNLE